MTKQNKKRIVLGSASPRRKELLEQIGVEFEIKTSDKEEIYESIIPTEIVQELEEAEGNVIDTIVIGADTVVVHDNKILGKPSDEAEAFHMLKSLAGDTHQVYTGVAMLVYGEDGEAKEICHAERTEVFVHEMSDEEIRNYIASGEPMDKAGAYGIQGKAAAFIEKIEGDYNNVVGLPIARIYQELKQLGIDVYKFS